MKKKTELFKTIKKTDLVAGALLFWGSEKEPWVILEKRKDSHTILNIQSFIINDDYSFNFLDSWSIIK